MKGGRVVFIDGLHLDHVYVQYGAIVGVILGVLFIFSTWLYRRMAKRNAERLGLSERLLAHIQPSAGLESNLNYMLEIVDEYITAPSYSFYVLQDKKRQLALKAIRHREGAIGTVGPSYSGLVHGVKEVYHPPLQLSAESLAAQTELIKEGEVPLLVVPVGKAGLIRLGPIRKVTRKERRMLDYISQLLTRFLLVLIDAEQLQREAEVIVTSGEALHKISAIALDSDETVGKLLGMAAVALSLDAGFIAIPEEGMLRIAASTGLSRDAERQLSGSMEWQHSLMEWLGERGTKVLRPDEALPAGWPAGLSDERQAYIAVSRFNVFGQNGLLAFAVASHSNDNTAIAQLASVAASISADLSSLIGIQHQTKMLTQSKAELLKSLSRSIDNLNPYTTGYSELMSRYSVIIAQEMGLSPSEIRDIALAAYVSNIGMLGLSEDLYLKEGQFTEMEFEKMKLHAEVGASIVEMTLGNKTVAACIRHHHERIDGNGYPAGLKGEDIPVGSRIIAVVQTFLAKIQGRKYREPLAFDKSLALLRSASGTQLDAVAVEALLAWFKRKQGEPELAGRSLGRCWEMCCVPKEICAGCPAYGREDVNCWEVPGNNCQAHGKSCSSCPVRTELATRWSDGGKA
jgi:hypothetical protein